MLNNNEALIDKVKAHFTIIIDPVSIIILRDQVGEKITFVSCFFLSIFKTP